MKRLLPLLLTVLLAAMTFAAPAMAAENKFYFDKDYNSVAVNDLLQLVLIRQGDCADDGVLTFTSSNQRVATVDDDGVVFGVKKGTATITAKLQGAKRSWTARLEVKVIQPATGIEVTTKSLPVYHPWDEMVAEHLDANSPYADLPVLVMSAGKSLKISANVTPADATNRTWQLTTSDTKIVSVSGTSFSPKRSGECLVTVQSKQNPEVFVAYRALVVQPVTRVQVTGEEKTLYIGEQIMLQAKITPDTATIQDVIWSSDKEDNAIVDEYGVVTGVSKGSAKITAKAADGSGRYGTFTVTVRQQAEEIRLSAEEFSLKTGYYKTLSATVLPSTTNDRSVTWESSDASVAKVSTGGRVTAVSPGTAIITCRSKTHPFVFSEAIVHVYQPVTKIAFTQSEAYVANGESITLNWTVSPDTATDASVTLSTNKTDVLRVQQNGVITGLKRGEAYVYAKANDGSDKQGRIKITVTQPVQGVEMKYSEISVGVGDEMTNTATMIPSDATITNMTWTVEDARIATVSGKKNKPTVTGRSWGETTVIGVTEDGSYVTTFLVRVGDMDEALKITNLYAEDDYVRIQVQNQSNLTITRFYYEIELFDAWGNELDCNAFLYSNRFEGSYNYTLEPGDATRHGRFSFGDEFVRPEGVGIVVMRITGYRTDDGATHGIDEDDRASMVWKATVIDENNY